MRRRNTGNSSTFCELGVLSILELRSTNGQSLEERVSATDGEDECSCHVLLHSKQKKERQYNTYYHTISARAALAADRELIGGVQHQEGRGSSETDTLCTP